jgi:malate dehydrogenase
MKITIIGATGNVGSCAAFSITEQRLADELVLIDDPRPDMLALHALDLNTAATGHDMLVQAGHAKDMRDSDIVVIAAGSAKVVKSRLEVLPANIPIVKGICDDIERFCPDAVVITATNPVCPLNYGMSLCAGLDRRKLIGYTYNDSIRFRMRVAEALGVEDSRVEGMVIGEHGDSQVLLFSSVRMGGKPVTFSDEMKRKLRQQVPDGQKVLEELRGKTGRTAAWTTAVGLAAVCRAIIEDTGEMIPCSMALEGEYGYSRLSMSVPVILGRDGVRKIIEVELAADEKDYLKKSVSILEPAMRYVEDFIKKSGYKTAKKN